MELLINAVRGHILQYYYTALSAGLTVACLVTLYSPQISFYIPALTTYGKTAMLIETQPCQLLKWITIPKKFFAHFYLVGLYSVGAWFIACYWILNYQVTMDYWRPETTYYLKVFNSAENTIPYPITFIVLVLLSIHLSRRCYESLFVSIYSATTMNFFHYIMGVVHYAFLPLVVMTESKIALPTPDMQGEWKLDYIQLFGIVLFLWCNVQQHSVVQQMANLRTIPRGCPPIYVHSVCYGGWFKYVSCPHFFFEVLIYCALYLILHQNHLVKYVLFFVVVNQTFAAMINHRWYQQRFRFYPKERKAIYPYIL